MPDSATQASTPASEPKRLSDIHPETVWIDRDHNLVQQRSGVVVRAIAALGRRANTTRQIDWVARDIETRCETGRTPKSVTSVLDPLVASGMVSAVSRRHGCAHKVTFAKVPSNRRLMLPLSVGWEYQWHADALTGPRYGSDTGSVLRWVLAILQVCDRNGSQFVFTTKKSARIIAKEIGVSTATYERLQATAYSWLADAEWVTWVQRTRRDGGRGTLEVTINFRLLPPLKTPHLVDGGDLSSEMPRVEMVGDTTEPETTRLLAGEGPSIPEGGGPGISEGTPRTPVREQMNTGASEMQMLAASASLQSSALDYTQAATTEKEGGTTTPGAGVTDIATADVLTRGLSSQHAGDLQMDNTSANYDAWLLTLMAMLVDSKAVANPIALNLPHVQDLRAMMRAPYDAGWRAGVLAKRLARQGSPNRPVAALQWRVDNDLPSRPNHEDSNWTFKQQEEKAAFEAQASCRYADKYHQRTM